MSLPQNVKCPKCGGPMVSRLTRLRPKVLGGSVQRRFWSCRKYPDCDGTRDTDGRSRIEIDRDEW